MQERGFQVIKDLLKVLAEVVLGIVAPPNEEVLVLQKSQGQSKFLSKLGTRPKSLLTFRFLV